MIIAVVQAIGFSNSFNNPIVYAFMNENFKKNCVATVSVYLRRPVQPPEHSVHFSKHLKTEAFSANPQPNPALTSSQGDLEISTAFTEQNAGTASSQLPSRWELYPDPMTTKAASAVGWVQDNKCMMGDVLEHHEQHNGNTTDWPHHSVTVYSIMSFLTQMLWFFMWNAKGESLQNLPLHKTTLRDMEMKKKKYMGGKIIFQCFLWGTSESHFRLFILFFIYWIFWITFVFTSFKTLNIKAIKLNNKNINNTKRTFYLSFF